MGLWVKTLKYLKYFSPVKSY